MWKSLYELGTNENLTLSLCSTMEENYCMFDALVLAHNEATSKCQLSCIQRQFRSLITSIYTFDKTTPVISVNFATTEITTNEEYLIYDFSGIVGSLGGNLGLFIGFSFRDMFSFIIDLF